MLVQLVLTLGFALILSALTVHFRDIRDILSNVLTLWFFATPIIYPYHVDAPASWQMRLLNANPFTHLAMSYQEILFFAEVRSLEVAARARRASVVCFLFGYSSSIGCGIRSRRKCEELPAASSPVV